MTTTIDQSTMPDAETMIAYEDGSVGMAMFHYLGEAATNEDAAKIARDHGFELIRINFDEQGDIDDDLIRRHEDGENILSDWHPVKPDWTLALKTDNEDGPFALFVQTR
jgi:hypothetical protein